MNKPPTATIATGTPDPERDPKKPDPDSGWAPYRPKSYTLRKRLVQLRNFCKVNRRQK